MAQEKIKINDIEIQQPDEDGFSPNWETTYTEDSVRDVTGTGHFTPLFTVESYSFKVSQVNKQEAYKILQEIVPTPNKPTFQLHYYSWYYGRWRTDTFYVGKGTLNVKTLEENGEMLESISCNMIGVKPI